MIYDFSFLKLFFICSAFLFLKKSLSVLVTLPLFCLPIKLLVVGVFLF